MSAAPDDLPTRVRVLERDHELAEKSAESSRARIWAEIKDHHDEDDRRFEKLEDALVELRAQYTRMIASVAVACVLIAIDAALRLKG